HSRGPVRAEVGDDRDRRCLVGLGKADPARARVLRTDEGHAIPSAWPEAEVALPCVWLEQRAPARAERVAEVTVAASRDDRRDELLSGEGPRSEEHTSELQSPCNLVCRLLLEKKKNKM